MNGAAVMPESDNLFEVDSEATSLNDIDVDNFHRMMTQLLSASKRAQPDIQKAVIFLCTMAKAPNIDDYKKLKNLIKYLRGTIHLSFLFGWDKTGTLTWRVDAPFKVHEDMRSHMGASLIMGIVSVISLSLEEKINTKSLAEA